VLVDVPTYRRICGDTATADATVVAALADAQALLEEALNRRGVLESATRTENCRVYNMQQTFLFISGLAYPAATPITAVSSPAGVTFTGSEIRGITGVVFDLVTDYVNEFPIATITYTGGYTLATLPSTLLRALCLAARELVREPTAAASGAQSIRVGDLAVTYSGPQTPSAAVDAILQDPAVQKYKRRRPLR
jgi:hypothetical protein